MLAEQTLIMYADRLASDSPTPGGGSALAAVALNATALVEMAANVTVTKLKKANISQESLSVTANKLSQIRENFAKIIDGDANVFDCILTAMRLPKETLDQQMFRKQQMQQAYLNGAKIALDLMCNAVNALSLTEGVIEQADKFVVSDAHIGKSLLTAVAKNSLHIIEVNADCLTDQSLQQSIQQKATTLLNSIEQ